MRRDPSQPLSCCSTTILDLYPSGVEEAMPLGCEDSWFDELKSKAPSVVLVDKRVNVFTWPYQGFVFSQMKLHSKFLLNWCGGTDAPFNSMPSERVCLRFPWFLVESWNRRRWRSQTFLHLNTGVSTRTNVLIDAYHNHVIIFAAWLPSGSYHLIHPKYFCNVAPTLNFFKPRWLLSSKISKRTNFTDALILQDKLLDNRKV